MVCVYTATHTATGMFYIGCTNDLHVRKIKHYGDMRKGTHANQWMQYNYNFDKEFTWTWVDVENKEAGLTLEKEMIAQHVGNKLLMNTQGKPIREEYRQALIDSWTPERREALSARRKGVPASPETREKMSAALYRRHGTVKRPKVDGPPKPRGVKPSFKVRIKGVRYNSPTEASLVLGVELRTLYSRLHNTRKKWIDWEIMTE